jgi:transposase InsO family protein
VGWGGGRGCSGAGFLGKCRSCGRVRSCSGASAARQDPRAVVAVDLVGRHFRAAGPDRLWVADLVYVPHGGGGAVPERGAGRVDPAGGGVGGARFRPHVELVLDALEMAR